MARTSVATDNFNRASLGTTDWGQLNSGFGLIQITGSVKVRGGAAFSLGSVGAARWIGAGTFTDDQYASMIVTGFANNSTDENIGVICRASADTDGARDMYGFTVCGDSPGPNYTTILYKIVNGTYTALNSAAQAWTGGDELSLEVEGTTIRGCRNGVALGGAWTQTDSSLTTGNPGVAGAGSTMFGDDWDGGNITSGGGGVSLAYLHHQPKTLLFVD